MENCSRKPTRKSSKRKAIKKIYKRIQQKRIQHKKNQHRKIHKRRQKRISLFTAFAILLLFIGGALAVTSVRIGFLLIVRPSQVLWVNHFLPEWAKIKDVDLDLPQSRKQIENAIYHQGQIAGKVLPLAKTADQSFLLPIFRKRPNCQSDCQKIVELRAYNISQRGEVSRQKHYEMVARLKIEGPEESFVIAPLVNITNETQGANIALPLNHIESFQGNNLPAGKWFYLRGQRNSGNHSVNYGHIIYYNLKRKHLKVMQSWTSPSGDNPKWQQVTGDNTKELVVNQTVGFEPRVRVYQAKSFNSIKNPIRLRPIALKPPTFKNRGYQKALLIARKGLWAPAFKWLQFIQKQHKGKISADSIAQIDLIRLHSELSTKQANINWASPSQQVQVYLIDGRWEKALQVFEKSPSNSKEIVSLLKADRGRLWDRVKVALQVNPNRPQVQTWGALILAAKFGDSRAKSWLKTQKRLSKSNFARLEILLARLENRTK